MAKILLNKSAYFHNLAQILAAVGDISRLWLILKDNAYGHGAREMAALAREFGVRKAVVNCEREAREIAGFFDEILILSHIAGGGEDAAFIYALNSAADVARIRAGVRAHIVCDTGMHRNGFALGEVAAAVRAARARGVRLCGAFTHFKDAECADGEFARQLAQWAEFKRVLAGLAADFGADFEFHSCNSAATERLAATGFFGRGGGENRADLNSNLTAANGANSNLNLTANATCGANSNLTLDNSQIRPNAVNSNLNENGAKSNLNLGENGANSNLNFDQISTNSNLDEIGKNRADLNLNFDKIGANLSLNSGAATPQNPAQNATENLAQNPAQNSAQNPAQNSAQTPAAQAQTPANVTQNPAPESIRVGIAQFGYSQWGGLDLRPVMSLWARRISSRVLAAGETMGYGGRFRAGADVRVATYDIGYGDGLLRYGGEGALALAGGGRLLGRMSMNSFCARDLGEEVCVFDDARVWARFFGTIEYEILTKLSPFIERVVV